ncbi:uncharacterized protein LOC122530008 isoform X2 [Frieseomelitta varia]|uniref:uncharacterized protein LOC122530008 isoform X2 n=1 Tax=Frieseomelitta varia TaxID=561572 RepID=UPI001CB6806A|nr:uncharacterized protein LOC122530008 isoform X2 [Frieseomelitta varia]
MQRQNYWIGLLIRHELITTQHRGNFFCHILQFVKHKRNTELRMKMIEMATLHLKTSLHASYHGSGYSLSIIPGVSRICRKPCSILFRSISAYSIDFLSCNYLKIQQISQYSLNQFSSY